MSEEGFILSDYEKGFLEGIIDGEGCISLSKHKKYGEYKRGFSWMCRVVIGNANKPLLEKVKAICGGGSISYSQGFYNYSIGTKILEGILPQITLVVKEEQRVLILEAINLLKEHSIGRTQNDSCLEQIYQDIRALNCGKGKLLEVIK